MRIILSLLEEARLPSLESLNYQITTELDSSCDVLLCAFEHIEFASSLVDPLECFIVVALENPHLQQNLIPSTFNAWININKLHKLPDMLNAYCTHIDEKVSFKETKELLKRLVVDTMVHDANLKIVKTTMRQSTKEIEGIFESRVEEMRAIHKDASVALEHLAALKTEISPGVFESLEGSWNTTHSILARTDEVIKAMFSFVTVLQCEDRISQMIDGVGAIMNSDINDITSSGFLVNQAHESELKMRLVPFYTIQDQRDYAMGKDVEAEGCQSASIDIDDFILF